MYHSEIVGQRVLGWKTPLFDLGSCGRAFCCVWFHTTGSCSYWLQGCWSREQHLVHVGTEAGVEGAHI